jgi:hypothetical protein
MKMLVKKSIKLKFEVNRVRVRVVHPYKHVSWHALKCRPAEENQLAQIPHKLGDSLTVRRII